MTISGSRQNHCIRLIVRSSTLAGDLPRAIPPTAWGIHRLFISESVQAIHLIDCDRSGFDGRLELPFTES